MQNRSFIGPLKMCTKLFKIRIKVEKVKPIQNGIKSNEAKLCVEGKIGGKISLAWERKQYLLPAKYSQIFAIQTWLTVS